MNKINFHSIKSIKVPEELRAKVIAIPEHSGKKSGGFYNRHLRIAVAAAVLTVITAFSVVLFSKTNGSSPVPAKPSPFNETVGSSERSADVPPTEHNDLNSVSATENEPTVPTASVIKINADNDVRSATEQVPRETVNQADPTASQHEIRAVESGSTEPHSAPTATDEAPTSAPSTEPSAETQTPWNPKPPTEATSCPPTEAPTTAPTTESPTETRPPWNPHFPIEATEEPFTEEPQVYFDSIIVTISRDLLPSDELVYCRIESPDGDLYGDYGLFDEERLMIPFGSSNQNGITYYAYSYPLLDYFNIPSETETDLLNCYIYDSQGHILTTKVRWR